MVDQQVVNTAGRVVEESAIQEFKGSLCGELIRPGNEGYDAARKVWNGMFDRRPTLIVRCTGTADVVTAVNFARDNRLQAAVRGVATASRATLSATEASSSTSHR